MLLNKESLARWREDIRIASTWATTPLIYFTFAEMLYSNSQFIKNAIPNHSLYLIVSGLFFLPLFKIIGRLIIGFGLWGSLIDYRTKINPYTSYRLTVKDQIIWKVLIASSRVLTEIAEKHDVDASALISAYNRMFSVYINGADSEE